LRDTENPKSKIGPLLLEARLIGFSNLPINFGKRNMDLFNHFDNCKKLPITWNSTYGKIVVE
jgi:hypothetical protein